MGRAVSPPCCLTQGQTMVEVMKIMATSFKRSQHALLHSVPPTLQKATTHACVRDSWTLTGMSGLVSCGGHCSFLLGPGVHKVFFMPSKSLFSQSCVSSAGSMAGLMVTTSKRAYVIPRSAAPRAPVPAAGHCPCTSTRDTQTQFWLSLCGLGMHFVPFPDLSSSADQALGKCTVLGGPCMLITSPIPATRFYRCPMRALS